MRLNRKKKLLLYLFCQSHNVNILIFCVNDTCSHTTDVVRHNWQDNSLHLTPKTLWIKVVSLRWTETNTSRFNISDIQHCMLIGESTRTLTRVKQHVRDRMTWNQMSLLSLAETFHPSKKQQAYLMFNLRLSPISAFNNLCCIEADLVQKVSAIIYTKWWNTK